MPDVDGMLDAMPLNLFYRWGEFNQLQPFTPERADMRIASLAMVVQKFGGVKHPKPEPFIYSDVGKRKAGPKRGGMSSAAMKDVLFGGTIREAQKMGIDPSTLYGKASDSQRKRIGPSPNDSVQAGDETGSTCCP